MSEKELDVVCEGCFKELCKINEKAHSKMFDDCDTYILCGACFIEWKKWRDSKI